MKESEKNLFLIVFNSFAFSLVVILSIIALSIIYIVSSFTLLIKTLFARVFYCLNGKGTAINRVQYESTYPGYKLVLSLCKKNIVVKK
jgi:hypothetical protein